jgi:hypothetical protein
LEVLGCDVAQGFYFAQALDGPTFQSWVRNYTAVDAVEPLVEPLDDAGARPALAQRVRPGAASGVAQ